MINNKYKVILKSANRFKTIADEIYNKTYIDNPLDFYCSQYFVNSIFSIELYLKSISEFDNKNYEHSHLLSELFDSLSNNRKTELKELYEDIYDFIVEQENAFVKWRYYFEYGNLSGYVIKTKKIMEVLKKYCENIK